MEDLPIMRGTALHIVPAKRVQFVIGLLEGNPLGRIVVLNPPKFYSLAPAASGKTVNVFPQR